jgi:hypothetical protein
LRGLHLTRLPFMRTLGGEREVLTPTRLLLGIGPGLRKCFIGRAQDGARTKKVLVRAFDEAVRRKPLAFAADAVGLWELRWHGT